MTPIFTIGHSTHSMSAVVDMLRSRSVNAVADVRSSPRSGINPDFNRDEIESGLSGAGIAYVYLGAELGGRSTWAADYVDGRVDYERLAAKESFRVGLARLTEGASRYSVAMLCAEGDPLRCHRTFLIAPELEQMGYEVVHILGDGTVETNDEAMSRLLTLLGLGADGLFDSRERLIGEARKIQSRRIAYVDRGERRRSVASP